MVKRCRSDSLPATRNKTNAHGEPPTLLPSGTAYSSPTAKKMPSWLPENCVLAWYAAIIHAAYITHVACTEVYDAQTRCLLHAFNVRYDFSSLHPLLLEWVHTLETSVILAFCAVSCGAMQPAPEPALVVVALYSLCGVFLIICSPRQSALFGRRLRVSLAFSIFFVFAPSLLDERVATVAVLAAHAHAIAVPSATMTRLCSIGEWRAVGMLFTPHVVALWLGVRSASKGPCADVAAAAFLVFVARELALACDRKWPRGASLQLRGFGSQHAAHDLYPPTPFDAILAALLPSVDAPDEFDDLPLLLDAKDVESERETEMV